MGQLPQDILNSDPIVENATRSASKMIKLRNEASRMAQGELDYEKKQAASQLQGIVEKAIKDTHGDKGAAFDLALKRYGATKDVRKAAGESAEHLSEGALPTSRIVEGSKGHKGMFPERDRLVAALAGNIPDATLGSGPTRALYTSLLLGAPLAAGGVSKIAGGDASWGTVPTTGLAAALIAGLSRRAPTKAEIDAIRRLVMGTGIGADPFN